MIALINEKRACYSSWPSAIFFPRFFLLTAPARRRRSQHPIDSPGIVGAPGALGNKDFRSGGGGVAVVVAMSLLIYFQLRALRSSVHPLSLP